jgi:hypothetical protein
VQGLKDRSQNSYLKTYEELYNYYNQYGHKPEFQRIDNESSHLILKFFNFNNTTIQFVPPNMHRANKAERAIRTVKNALISMPYGADTDCPAKLWYKGALQLMIILNHTRPWHEDETKSAWHGFHNKKYDFINNPIAPFGIAALIHETPTKRSSFEVNTTEVFYKGPALNHHRCVNTYNCTTEKKK